MGENILEKFFEHNLWANLQILQACSSLTDEQLDAEPQSATKGTIRLTLAHLAESELGYLADLTGVKSRFNWETSPSFTEMQEALSYSGEVFRSLVSDGSNGRLSAPVHSEDGYTIEPWVLVLQAINHATEHREQIKSMLTALGVKPPRVDGWGYARLKNALIAPAK
jgi:uncharacterized damage-inducible protein DinB